jgi:syntaxin 6
VKKQLKRHIKNAESTLKDVHMTVQVVETSRHKFPHIDNTEMYERLTLVSTSRDRISRAKTEMNSDDVKSKMVSDERAKAIRRAGGGINQTQQELEHTEYIADSQAKQSLLMQAQDETLDELGEAVTRVGEMAENIHEEIGLQNKMLTTMEEDLSDAEEKLGVVMGKLAKLLKTKNKCHLGTILILSLVVVVLFFLVIYT